jgi:protein-tyrosine-phosphatase
LRSGAEGPACGNLLREMTKDRVYNVLFLCTGNSARSILAESLLKTLGRGKFRAFSAGSFPKGQVHPMAIELLQRMNLPSENLRSKSWDEFAAPGAAPIDLIFTVCDNAGRMDGASQFSAYRDARRCDCQRNFVTREE